MEIGESQAVLIDSKPLWNVTGIQIKSGENYRFDAAGEWNDASIRCGPEGYASPNLFLKLGEPLRRAPGENWFTLIGAVDSGEKTAFAIGKERVLIVPKTGVLSCFANDIRFMYWNNSGSVRLIVTRLG